MMRLTALLKLVLICGLTSGCLAPRSFPDPSIPMTGYTAVERQASPIPLRVSIVFERRGEHFPRADAILQGVAERTLRGSGTILPDASAPGEIKVIVNNTGDLGDAAIKGFGTGLTFGLVGTTVTDNYEMSVTITDKGQTITRTGIRHAIRSAIGNTSLPDGVQPVSATVAFDRVVESMLLGALADMQRSGQLPRAAAAVSRTS